MESVDCKTYVGLITRLMASAVSLEGSEVYMITECDMDFPVGEYLVVESSGEVNYLARITESKVEDIYSIARTPILSLQQELAMGVRYIPRFIKLELVAECIKDDCKPPSTPPRIHSMVRVPREGEVATMLSLPSGGVELGSLALPNGREVKGNYVKLPLEALNHHVLVVGTTGSGKTTLLKNIALSLLTNYGDVTVMALDTVGHYNHLVFNNVPVKVLIPMMRNWVKRNLRGGDARALAKSMALKMTRQYLNDVFKAFGLKLGKLRIRIKGRVLKSGGTVIINEVNVTLEDKKVNVTLIPWALSTRSILYRVHEVTGMLTDQARMFYGRIIREVMRRSRGELTFNRIFQYLTSPSDVQMSGRLLLNYEVVARDLGIHTSTLENILRTILAVDESGIVDVAYSKGGVEFKVPEPSYGKILEPGYVVLHLVGLPPVAQRIFVYRVLDKVYGFMGPEHLRNRGRLAVILVDEAHLFFPQARSEDERSMLERHLTRLTRLGRGRGISVVFATHIPDDLNDAVLQLTNTKIVLRSDERVLERLNVPQSERRFLTVADAGVAYVKSFTYKYPLYIKVNPMAYHVG
ncbi:ATP-binding protein [Caldivirga sp.]|uniref:ATP-binding protein n=2 Tax=Caldivirga sp. TaxID=2080243 RepID=UPI003D0CAB69